MDQRLERALHTIDAQLHTRITMAALAEEVGLSTSQLTRLFRRQTGRSPAAYLHVQRMIRARLLIERTALSVAEVMAQVGIADPSHFARDFRRMHGFSPRTLRTQLRVAGPPARYMAVERDG